MVSSCQDEQPRRLWLFVLVAMGIGWSLLPGCADNVSAAGDGVNLADAVKISGSFSGPGRRGWTRFFDRKTGKYIENINLIVDAEFSDGLAPAKREPLGQYGYIDSAGQTVIPFQYEAASPFDGGRAVVEGRTAGGKIGWGLIDRNGRWVVPPDRYEEIGPYSEGRCAFRVGQKWGFLDCNGRVAIPARYTCDENWPPPVFKSGVAFVREEDRGCSVGIDYVGNVVSVMPKGIFVASPEIQNGLVVVGMERTTTNDGNATKAERYSPYQCLWGYSTLAGRVVIRPAFTATGDFHEGLLPVSKGQRAMFRDDFDPMEFGFEGDTPPRWGYIDVAGHVVVPFVFERAGNFSEGLARVRKGGRWGYIDSSGNLAIPCEYQWVKDFKNGLAEVWGEKEICIIDRTGRIVIHTGIVPAYF
jgi:hypothetical protein